jgi:hypothetical protein
MSRLIRPKIKIKPVIGTKKAAVTQALAGNARYHQQLKITELFGKIDFDPAYDYKRQRRRA